MPVFIEDRFLKYLFYTSEPDNLYIRTTNRVTFGSGEFGVTRTTELNGNNYDVYIHSVTDSEFPDSKSLKVSTLKLVITDLSVQATTEPEIIAEIQQELANRNFNSNVTAYLVDTTGGKSNIGSGTISDDGDIEIQ